MRKRFGWLKGAVLLLALIALLIGGMRLIGHAPGRLGMPFFGQHSMTKQAQDIRPGGQGAWQDGGQAGQFVQPGGQADAKQPMNGRGAWQGGGQFAQPGQAFADQAPMRHAESFSFGHRRSHGGFWMIALVPLLLIALVGSLLFKRTSGRRRKYLGAFLLALILLPVLGPIIGILLTALVILLLWKFWRRKSEQPVTVDHAFSAEATITTDFLDQWEQETRNKNN